jgi:hypothetical protein
VVVESGEKLAQLNVVRVFGVLMMLMMVQKVKVKMLQGLLVSWSLRTGETRQIVMPVEEPGQIGVQRENALLVVLP